MALHHPIDIVQQIAVGQFRVNGSHTRTVHNHKQIIHVLVFPVFLIHGESNLKNVSQSV